MKKYKITYQYTTQGVVEVEAEGLKEAAENYHSTENYGDREKVIKNKIVNIETIN